MQIANCEISVQCSCILSRELCFCKKYFPFTTSQQVRYLREILDLRLVSSNNRDAFDSAF